MSIDDARIAWDKGNGLVPAIVQHADDGRVLMLGYMNADALARTRESGLVTFWSRSRAALWTKGEGSGHVLRLASIALDCDGDTLLVRAHPAGPTCHLGTATCFGDAPDGDASLVALAAFARLDATIARRERERPAGSYTTTLFDAGLPKIAQKVGEEGVETALAGVVQDDAALLGEAADLVYHLVVLLRARGLGMADVARVLAGRER